MIALFAALGLAAAAPPTGDLRLTITPSNGFLKAPVECLPEIMKAAGAKRPVLSKLGDLPDANMEIAVARSDRSTGCPRPLIVAYRVSH